MREPISAQMAVASPNRRSTIFMASSAGPRRASRSAHAGRSRTQGRGSATKMASDMAAENAEKKFPMRTVIAASAIGTTIEWYDFLIYATAASLVLNKLFFPPRTRWWGSSYRSAPSASASSLDRSAPSLKPLRRSAWPEVDAYPDAGEYGHCNNP